MKIGIFALLQNIDPAYSVATVVQSHIRIIKKYGHEPVLLTSTDSSVTSEEVSGAEVRKVIPVWRLRDYARNEPLTEEDMPRVKEVLMAISPHIQDLDRLIDHDCCLQGWFKVHGDALNLLPNVCHVIHSVPGTQPVASLGEGHRLLVLNENQVEKAKQAYDTQAVTAISNPLDIREYLNFGPITRRFIEDWNLLSYDYIFTYPLSATRWNAKGVPFLTEFTKYMSSNGYRVAVVLLLAHANAIGDVVLDFHHYSNASYPEHKNGVPREVVRDFMLLSDGFFLPSHSELSPLVHMEAALAKNIVYLNGSLNLTSKARKFNAADRFNWNFDALLRDFLESSKHLDEFRRVRKDMNEDVIGKRLIDWICA